MNPLKTLIIVVTIEISSAITIIAGIPFPIQNIIIGASATLGSAFNTTKYGSNIFETVGYHHNITAIITPRIVPSENPSIVS